MEDSVFSPKADEKLFKPRIIEQNYLAIMLNLTINLYNLTFHCFVIQKICDGARDRPQRCSRLFHNFVNTVDEQENTHSGEDGSQILAPKKLPRAKATELPNTNLKEEQGSPHKKYANSPCDKIGSPTMSGTGVCQM